ncbi:hypothetical protein [Rhodococcus pyridinivorans]|uniref:hypothetical protein n=1 Tax=Rhodococcus pyridinivorans TaxID=103816 RepID=UPI00228359DA|nr:hypothetical protein [Rhodococcus pyridinivorans]WAL49307.1 hypothetical protein OQN32_24435 [Rhodococcus pyridinivorans]
MWNKECGIAILLAYNDIGSNPEANKTFSDFVRGKIRKIVKDPETAENLIPTYPYGGKRPVVGMNYYDVYNRDHVSLVSLRKTPITKATPRGLVTSEGEHEFDVIIVASGFDAFTGALTRADIRGRSGVSLGEKWDNGNNLTTYLGVHHSGFPNLFTITGPHFPVLVNAFAIDELMAEWILTCITRADAQGIEEIEPTKTAEYAWTDHVNEVGSASIHASVDSWYRGANVEGKGRAFYGYSGEFLTFQEWFRNAEDFTAFTASEAHAPVSSAAANN